MNKNIQAGNIHFIPGEPPNNAREHIIEILDPATAPPGGEDKSKRLADSFSDTDGYLKDFEQASTQVAHLLKKA